MISLAINMISYHLPILYAATLVWKFRVFLIWMKREIVTLCKRKKIVISANMNHHRVLR